MEEKKANPTSITAMWKELIPEEELRQMNDELDACEKQYENMYGTKMRKNEEDFDINEKKNNEEIEPVEDPNYPECDNPIELMEMTKEESLAMNNKINDLN